MPPSKYSLKSIKLALDTEVKVTFEVLEIYKRDHPLYEEGYQRLRELHEQALDRRRRFELQYGNLDLYRDDPQPLLLMIPRWPVIMILIIVVIFVVWFAFQVVQNGRLF